MMNQITPNSGQNSGRSDVNEGWSVIVYSGDRRLLCSLHPSHGWMFAIGIVVGFLVAVIGYSSVIQATPDSPSSEQPALEQPDPPLTWID
ncbi:MAG: hypothetical protein WBA57_20710 [Elainellaceae cyanobacterium]